MHSAVLYIKDQKELELSKIRLFDKPLINYTVDTIKKLNVDDIYLVGDINIDGLLKRNHLEEVFGELKYSEGKCLLLIPFYPLLEKEDYERLLNFDKKPPVHADTINQHCCSKLHHLFFPKHLLHHSEHATLQ